MIVTGEVGKKRSKIAIRDGRDGAALGQAAFPGANPRKMAAEVARTFWSKLGGDVERGSRAGRREEGAEGGGRGPRGRRTRARRGRRG